MKYSDKLRQIMAAKNITVTELAQRAGVTGKTICNFRGGRNSARPDMDWKPSVETVTRVAVALGEPVEVWLEMVGHHKPSPLSVAAAQHRTRLVERLADVTDPGVFVQLNRYLDKLTTGKKPTQATPSVMVSAVKTTLPEQKPGIRNGLPPKRQPIPQALFTHAN